MKGTRETVVIPPSNPIPEYRDVLTFKPGVKGKDQRYSMFFSVLADAIEANKPYAEWDKKFISNQLAKLGVTQGNLLILDAQENAFDQVIARGETMFGVKMNGWFLNPANHGDWVEDFWNRSYVIYIPTKEVGIITGQWYPALNMVRMDHGLVSGFMLLLRRSLIWTMRYQELKE